MDHDACEYQRQRWQSLKLTIHEQVDAVTSENVGETSRSLLQTNLLRGRGLLVRRIMKCSLDDTSRNPLFVQLVNAISVLVPEVGGLLANRLVLRFKRSFLNNDMDACTNTLNFLGHLVNHRVVDEILALEILQLLLRKPNECTIGLACSFLGVVGNLLKAESLEALEIILGRLREVSKDIVCATDYSTILSGEYDLDLVAGPVPSESLFIQLDEVMHAELSLNVFSFDKDFAANEEAYENRMRENSCEVSEDTNSLQTHTVQTHSSQEAELDKRKDAIQLQGLSGDSLLHAIMRTNEGSNNQGQQDTERDTVKEVSDKVLSVTEIAHANLPREITEAANDLPSSHAVTEAAHNLSATRPLVIKDMSEQERMGHQKTIYLTIMSSMSADEAVHKLLRLRMGNLALEKRHLLGDILIKCCIQEKTYSKYFGVVGEKLCRMSPEWHATFAHLFAQYYSEIDQYETNGLRNVGKFFGHMFASDVLAIESSLCVVHLSEETTTSAGRVMLKFVFQEMVEELGVPELEARFIEDTFVKAEINGLFPSVNLTLNDCNRLRFAINFFTAIGLGVLTQEMRQELQTLMNNSRGRTLDRQNRSDLCSESYSRSRSYSRSGSSRSRSYSRSRSPSKLP